MTLEKTLDLYSNINNMKKHYRYGRVKNPVSDSVADHSFRLAFMVSDFAREYKLNIDIGHAVELALYHDLGECFDGDIDAGRVYRGEVSNSDKTSVELNSIEKLMSESNKKAGERILALWREYEECKTLESKYVRVMDKVEAISHICDIGKNKILESPELTAVYLKKVLSYAELFPQLKELILLVQSKVKELFLSEGSEWKEEYNL